MKLSFATPASALAAHISAYYLVTFDYQQIDDTERADVGYLRFMLSGRGTIHYRSGHEDGDHAVMLIGPASASAPMSITGPLRSFGCVLLPEFWGGIVEASAATYANRALNAVDALGPEVLTLFDQLVSLTGVEAMGAAMDDFLIPKIKPLPRDERSVIESIGQWLSCYPIPAPEALYGACALSSRQVMRLSNQYFGAPPKLLARKFRALRTASRIVGTKGSVPDALANDYSDRAHMIREVKYFTGLTPRQLQVNSNPLMQATLHPDNFRTDAPWT
jgi:AraC-like DNA-binding protein